MDKDYLIAMSLVKAMLNSGLITDGEFDEINEVMKEKYKPVLDILVK